MKIIDIINEALREDARLFVKTNNGGPIEIEANTVILEEGFLIGELLVKYQDITSLCIAELVDVDYDEDGFTTPVYHETIYNVG